MLGLVCGRAIPVLLALVTLVFPITTHAYSLDASGTRADPEKGLKAGEEQKFEIAKDVFMKFCWIPSGEAQLGAPREELDYITKTFYKGTRPAYLDSQTEANRGKFKTKGFWLGKYTVTQAEWEAVMGGNPW
jgi:formylglycine-generating enzyme required for sulfatase activity